MGIATCFGIKSVMTKCPIKLPFFNRKRYIVVKCYTWHAGVAESAPISTNHPQKIRVEDSDAFLSPVPRFSTCWSRYGTRKNSFSLLAPVAFRFSTDGESAIHFSDAHNQEIVGVDYEHENDPTYASVKDTYMVKLTMPWVIDENSGTNFVIARHIQNTSMMNILSGVTCFKVSPAINVFNLISKFAHEYEVPFGTPLVGVYPMSDLPMHVETYHDTHKYDEIKQKGYLPHYKASAIKGKSLRETRH